MEGCEGWRSRIKQIKYLCQFMDSFKGKVHEY